MDNSIGFSCSSPNKPDDNNSTYRLASSNPKRPAGRRKFKETRHPVYHGVRRRNGDKWVCEVRKGSSRLWLGTYPTAEMAARAHDVAALAIRGHKACLNFADSAWRLPIPDTDCDADIKEAAVEAAEGFRPRKLGGHVSSSSSSSCSSFSTSVVSDAESSSRGESSTSLVVEELEREEVNKYVDEEAMFFLPELMVEMAEGLMVAPPPLSAYGHSSDIIDQCYFESQDFSIWSF